MFSKTSFLVTGGAGYIGTHVVWALCEQGATVVVLDNLSNGHPEYLPKGVVFYRGDIGDEDCVKKIFATHAIDGVIHLAASIEAGISMKNPLAYYGNNVSQTVSFLKTLCTLKSLPILFSSTAAVYAVKTEGLLTEHDPIEPLNPYGRSKWMVECILQDVARVHHSPIGIFRYFNAAGADSEKRCGELHDPETHLIPLALQTALGLRPSISIYGTDYPTPDGTCIRDYIHVSDLAYAHVLGMHHLLKKSQSFTLNLGTGHGFSVKEVIDTVHRVTGVDFKVLEEPRRMGDPSILVANASVASYLLGWKPKQSLLEEMVKHAYYFMEGR